MLLWLTFATLAALVGWLLMRLPVASATADDGTGGDLAVYRDQLNEVEADATRGLIGESEAAAARTEIARRMLKAAEGAPASSAAASAKTAAPSTRVLVVSAAAIPLLALALYLKLGAPELPSRPLAARIKAMPANPSSPSATNDIMAKIEAHLRDHPDDGRGWSVIAPAYLSQGRPQEAAEAFERAIALSGETVDKLAGLAKANLMIGNGIVNETARTAYERALKLDANYPEARFWLAIYDEQNGRSAAAVTAFRALAASLEQSSPWRAAAEERLAALTDGKSASGPPQGVQSPGPLRSDPSPAEFVAAAQKLKPEMRDAMIGGRMIPKAAAAVKENPKDFAAWMRLITGHVALGHAAEAQGALGEARKAAEGDASALAALDKLAADLGLKS